MTSNKVKIITLGNAHNTWRLEMEVILVFEDQYSYKKCDLEYQSGSDPLKRGL